MNIYFLVEGKRTEKKVYPKWLKHLIPALTQITDPFEIEENAYYVFSGNGFPSILDNHLRNSVSDINNIGKFNYLVMCIDADEAKVKGRIEDVKSFMKKEKIELRKNTEFVLMVQNRCIETWFLGNRKVFKNNPDGERLRSFVNFYNISNDDPELMGKMTDFDTYAQFHAAYLKEVIAERKGRYTKKNPGNVVRHTYLEELIKRANDTDHIKTFGSFIEFCGKVRSEMQENF